MSKTIKIGGASGYWGESAMSTPQLLAAGGLDYIIYDYLAEITMSIMARARAKDPNKGFATDFIEAAMRPNLAEIAYHRVKIISNAGGVNPTACADALRAMIKAQGLSLSVGVVTGDNLMRYDHDSGPHLDVKDRFPTDIYSGITLEDRESIASANAYLGAFPIAAALDSGADIVITGRCVDSALTLGACIHSFRTAPKPAEGVGYHGDARPIYDDTPPAKNSPEYPWSPYDFDRLASGSLAGHIIECGPQATGGNFTDWDSVTNIAQIGYPIAEIAFDGSFTITKPEGTGGIVNLGTVSEQMLYEIGDPRRYVLPDVICDFSAVEITQSAVDCVNVSPAKGHSPTDEYKTSLTYLDGFRSGQYLTFYGDHSVQKAQIFSAAVLTRARERLSILNLPDYSEVSQDIIGSGSQSGASHDADEVVLKLAVKHDEAHGIAVFLKEMAGIGLAAPPGLSGFTGAGRPKPSPVVRLMSYMTRKSSLSIEIDVDGKTALFYDEVFYETAPPENPVQQPPAIKDILTAAVPLQALAWGRSGDKGDKANVGVIARKAEYMPYIWASLTEENIRKTFAHFLEDDSTVERFHLPGCNAMNILMDRALGGGGAASLRNDAQGKGFAQLLLTHPIKVSETVAKDLK